MDFEVRSSKRSKTTRVLKVNAGHRSNGKITNNRENNVREDTPDSYREANGNMTQQAPTDNSAFTQNEEIQQPRVSQLKSPENMQGAQPRPGCNCKASGCIEDGTPLNFDYLGQPCQNSFPNECLADNCISSPSQASTFTTQNPHNERTSPVMHISNDCMCNVYMPDMSSQVSGSQMLPQMPAENLSGVNMPSIQSVQPQSYMRNNSEPSYQSYASAVPSEQQQYFCQPSPSYQSYPACIEHQHQQQQQQYMCNTTTPSYYSYSCSVPAHPHQYICNSAAPSYYSYPCAASSPQANCICNTNYSNSVESQPQFMGNCCSCGPCQPPQMCPMYNLPAACHMSPPCYCNFTMPTPFFPHPFMCNQMGGITVGAEDLSQLSASSNDKANGSANSASNGSSNGSTNGTTQQPAKQSTPQQRSYSMSQPTPSNLAFTTSTSKLDSYFPAPQETVQSHRVTFPSSNSSDMSAPYAVASNLSAAPSLAHRQRQSTTPDLLPCQCMNNVSAPVSSERSYDTAPRPPKSVPSQQMSQMPEPSFTTSVSYPSEEQDHIDIASINGYNQSPQSQPQPQQQQQAQPKPQPKSQPKSQLKPEPKPQPIPQPKPQPKPQSKPQPQYQHSIPSEHLSEETSHASNPSPPKHRQPTCRCSSDMTAPQFSSQISEPTHSNLTDNQSNSERSQHNMPRENISNISPPPIKQNLSNNSTSGQTTFPSQQLHHDELPQTSQATSYDNRRPCECLRNISPPAYERSTHRSLSVSPARSHLSGRAFSPAHNSTRRRPQQRTLPNEFFTDLPASSFSSNHSRSSPRRVTTLPDALYQSVFFDCENLEDVAMPSFEDCDCEPLHKYIPSASEKQDTMSASSLSGLITQKETTIRNYCAQGLPSQELSQLNKTSQLNKESDDYYPNDLMDDVPSPAVGRDDSLNRDLTCECDQRTMPSSRYSPAPLKLPSLRQFPAETTPSIYNSGPSEKRFDYNDDSSYLVLDNRPCTDDINLLRRNKNDHRSPKGRHISFLSKYLDDETQPISMHRNISSMSKRQAASRSLPSECLDDITPPCYCDECSIESESDSHIFANDNAYNASSRSMYNLNADLARLRDYVLCPFVNSDRRSPENRSYGRPFDSMRNYMPFDEPIGSRNDDYCDFMNEISSGQFDTLRDLATPTERAMAECKCRKA